LYGVFDPEFPRGVFLVAANKNSGKKDKNKGEVVGLVGVGLDSADGHKRITKGDEFLLVGGSRETHENMQGIAMRFSESLKKRGKRLPETPVEEVIELLHKATE
jgi:hypothetical protein